MLNFLKESKKELEKVVWLTRSQVIKHTLVVIAFSLATAIFLGLIDFLMTIGIEKILS